MKKIHNSILMAAGLLTIAYGILYAIGLVIVPKFILVIAVIATGIITFSNNLKEFYD